jgi:glucokinase
MLTSYSAGIDLGGTQTKIALVSAPGNVLVFRKLPCAAGRPPEAALAEARRGLEQIAQECGLAYPPPDGCGIGTPGVVDHQTGWLTFSGPHGWRDVDLASLGQRQLGCEVSVDMDVNAGVLADLYLGCARASSDVLYVTWGTGIGSALVVGRQVYHSRGGAACNLGHTLADPYSDRLCYCGCRGCLEIEAGGRGLSEEAAQHLAAGASSILRGLPSPITPEQIAWAAEQGDALASAMLQRAALLMARALAGALAILNPDTAILAGGVSRCWPVIRHAFEGELRRRLPKFLLDLTRVVVSDFQEDAGAIGAALLRLHPGARLPE